LSGQSALAGEAITRGLTVAIDEINAKGGLLGGRKLELVRRDDEGNPAKGVVAARELIFKEKVAVLFGGLDTPVSMAIVPVANQEKVPFMGPWAAGTRSPRTAPTPTTPSASRRSTRSSTWACSTTRRRPSRAASSA
jgi:branched-chain amino acid transport system substrate-binding protein